MVLIVDDDEGIREAVAAALMAEGHDVRCASSAGEAVEIVASEHPSLILSDVHMPSGDGFLVLAASREVEDAPPVILLSAGGDVRDRHHAFESGAAAYLSKPFDLSSLLSIARRLLSEERPGTFYGR